MEVIQVLLPIALLLGLAFIGFFVWATKSGQYDDLDTPSIRVLFDDENTNFKQNNKEEKL